MPKGSKERKPLGSKAAKVVVVGGLLLTAYCMGKGGEGTSSTDSHVNATDAPLQPGCQQVEVGRLIGLNALQIKNTKDSKDVAKLPAVDQGDVTVQSIDFLYDSRKVNTEQGQEFASHATDYFGQPVHGEPAKTLLGEDDAKLSFNLRGAAGELVLYTCVSVDN